MMKKDNTKLLTEKKEIFSTPAILLRGVAGGLGSRMWPRVTSGGHRLPRRVSVASDGCGWPRGVASGLSDHGWPRGFADDLGIAGDLVGSRVAMGGRWWSLGVAVDHEGISSQFWVRLRGQFCRGPQGLKGATKG
jgi:hypothetical protein